LRVVYVSKFGSRGEAIFLLLLGNQLDRCAF
jgi:hypothetical protein